MTLPMQNRSARGTALMSLSLLGFVLTSGCSQSRDPKLAVYPIGSQVTLPPLIYTVVEADWKDELHGADGARIPKERFLLVSVTVTNSGGAESAIPLLTIIDSKGKEYMEEQKGDGVPQWLGFFRRIAPAQSESGRLLFDVPPGAYRLRVTSGGDPEQEKAALVEVPLSAEKDPAAIHAPIAPPGDTAPPGVKLK